MNEVTAAILIFSLIIVGGGTALFLHCERYSSADWGSRFKNGFAGVICFFVYRYHRLHYTYLPLPETAGAVVVSNHVSGLDPLLLIATSSRPLRFLIAREQYQRFGLRWIFRMAGCIPVEREKRPEIAMRLALKAIREGEIVALFPHGKIHLDTDPPRHIKKGAVKLAALSGCPIIPVRIEGVAAPGHTLRSLPVRSHARVVVLESISCTNDDLEEAAAKLTRLIETPQ